ncbi:HupE/UreJ family protein [Hahella ganghwensis]|uniref:HupE/UreJ family protein n=1 Tax=Hahella ganghwensis TaxID=286420 RepID=UPI00037ED330|nr:HupE/UreJ family protein [Hahella ganghwensis]
MRKLIFFWLFFVCNAQAHLSGFTDTSIQIAEPGIKIIYTLPSDNLLELDGSPGLENLADVDVTAGTDSDSFASEAMPPEAYSNAVADGWKVDSRKRNCHLDDLKAVRLDTVESYQYTLLFSCPQGLDDVEIYYSLFTEQWQGHRNYSRVYMADQQMRTRFAFDRNKLSVPVMQLLAEWDRSLDEQFFPDDPNKVIKELANADQSSAALDTGEAAIVWVDPESSESGLADPGFIWMGMEHIWGGIDHVLFVIALLLVPVSWKRWLLWISLFTVAHSITLALSYYDVIALPPSVTEPLIALTVLAIGIENIMVMRYGNSMLKWRTLIIPVFGLIHGVGFSYLLIELGSGLPAVGRLFYFNLGVELGQLALVAALCAPVVLLFRWSKGKALAGILSGNIALFGALWLWQRVVF